MARCRAAPSPQDEHGELVAPDDLIIGGSPCRIDGAGKEESAEREVVSLPVVFAIADAVPVRYRALVLLATFASMRWGELVGLRRENIDLAACGIRMAGRRTVSFPAGLVPELRWHLERFSEPGERGLVFV